MDKCFEIVGIILAAGSGRRMNAGMNKVWLQLGGRSLLERSIDTFRASRLMHHLVIVASPAELPEFNSFLDTRGYRHEVSVVAGGLERRDSVANALLFLQTWPGWTTMVEGLRRLVAIHDAARPLLTVELLQQGIDAALQYHATGLAVPVKDTIKQADGTQMVLNTPDRAGLWAMQTPQIFDFELITDSYQQIAATDVAFSDDCSVAEFAGFPVKLTLSSYQNLKITTPEDLHFAEALLQEREEQRKGAPAMRIGQGFDVHQLVHGRRLILGGVEIPYELGLLGHSDADVLLHAVMDALLGAIGSGDIGRHFPDTDPAYQGVDSTLLLTRVAALVREAGYRIANLDSTIVAQKPKLAGWIPEMRRRIAAVLELTESQVSVKATTTEQLGFTGRGEGIAALAVALVERQ